MSEVLQRYRTIADGFTARLEGITADQWSAQTPCSDWTAKDLVGHVVGVHRRMVAGLDGSTPAEVDLDGDLGAEWQAASGAVLSALDDPALASKVISTPFGDQPFESVVGQLVCTDTLVHTWDLATATGQNDQLDPDAVAKSMGFLEPLDEQIRFPGGFLPKIDPAPDADGQTRLLNFSGRGG
ncbi:MAG: TIGR03086 family metal-binding protein [Actinomycetota bacterium]|nr:TIGR03086 family metal-binding protein [Actinomycetota bacterium]